MIKFDQFKQIKPNYFKLSGIKLELIKLTLIDVIITLHSANRRTATNSFVRPLQNLEI